MPLKLLSAPFEKHSAHKANAIETLARAHKVAQPIVARSACVSAKTLQICRQRETATTRASDERERERERARDCRRCRREEVGAERLNLVQRSSSGKHKATHFAKHTVPVELLPTKRQSLPAQTCLASVQVPVVNSVAGLWRRRRANKHSGERASYFSAAANLPICCLTNKKRPQIKQVDTFRVDAIRVI